MSRVSARFLGTPHTSQPRPPSMLRPQIRMTHVRLYTLLGISVAFLSWTLLCPGEAQGQEIAATVDSSESVIHYTGTAPLHSWTGTSEKVQGLLILDVETPSESRVSLRAPVASFESGPDRRDRKMREVTEVGQYPYVRFRSTEIRPTMWGRSSEGHAGRWDVTGDLTFHGQTHPVETTVEVRVSEERVRAQTQFKISLSRFGIARPELFWVAPVGDTIRIDARIVGTTEEQPTIASRLSENRIEATGTHQIASKELRHLAAMSFSGERAGLEARFIDRAEAEERDWSLAFYGFAEDSTGLADAEDVTIRADQDSVDPLRIEGTTRQLDEGTTVEIKRMFFSRSDFETIAKALSVTATIGSARFSVGWNARADMRLLLKKAANVLSGQVSSRYNGSS